MAQELPQDYSLCCDKALCTSMSSHELEKQTQKNPTRYQSSIKLIPAALRLDAAQSEPAKQHHCKQRERGVQPQQTASSQGQHWGPALRAVTTNGHRRDVLSDAPHGF